MFEVHKQLQDDSFHLGDLELCRVHLMNNAVFPWLILIPKLENKKEFIDLRVGDQQLLMKEICEISKLMQLLLKPDKINIAALGNIVPQLHIHIVCRFLTDPCWPDPVWGKDKPKGNYDHDAKMLMINKLQPELRKIPSFKG